jgi:glucokinase
METECSFPAIKKKIAGALISGYSSNLSVFKDSPNKITPVDIRSAIEDGDRLVINVVKSAARNIGLALANCINILNPESIIMSGEMIEFGDPFISTIVDSAKEHIIPIQNISIEFAISDLMDTALPLGAASVVFSEFLQTETFKGICDIS